MALLHFGKKQKEQKPPTCACRCGGLAEEAAPNASSCCPVTKNEINSIKVLGAGCKSCHEQYENAKEAVANMKLPIEVEYVTDLQEIMGYGVMSMPALVVNEKVASVGRVLDVDEIEALLHKLGF